MPWIEKTFQHDYDASLLTKTGETVITCSDGTTTFKENQNEAIKMVVNDLCNTFDEAGFTEYEKINYYSVNIFGINYHFTVDTNGLKVTFDGCYPSIDKDYTHLPKPNVSHTYIPLTKGTGEPNVVICEYKIRVFYNTNYIYIHIIPGVLTATEAETHTIGFLFTFKGQLADGTEVMYISGNPNLKYVLECGILKVTNDLSRKFIKIHESLYIEKTNMISNENLCEQWFPDIYSRENILMLHPLNLFGGGLFIDGNIYKVHKNLIPNTNQDYFFELNGEEYYRPRGDRANSIVLKL